MDRTRIWPAVAAFMLLGISVVANQAEESRAAQAETGGGCAVWSVAETQSTEGQADALVDVDVLDPSNAWAAGSWIDVSGYGYTLVQRYTGTSWELVPSQQIGTGSNLATGVAVVAPNDVWVSGWNHDEIGVQRAMILRCNRSSCAPVTIPRPGNSTSVLRDITANAPNDVWATGSYFDTTTVTVKPLVMHYDGSEWTIVPVPTPSPGDADHYLNAISASGPNDVWVVGFSTGMPNDQALALHWNGSTWTQVTNLPELYNSRLSRLDGVHATAPNDVWAVGYYRIGTNRPVIFHWNGSTWTNESPSTDPLSGELIDVTASSSGDVWVTGRVYENHCSYCDSGIIMRYTGSGWESVPLPNVEGYKSFIVGISGEPDGQVWGVGFKRIIGAGDISNIAIHYPNRFSDLHSTNTFYPYVNCLLDRGIVSGYDDCTFRPNADVTRGQLSKIVAGSAGFNEPPGEQMFEDVPPGSTFYDWINRLARRGHVGGYPCGGPGEPCDENNRPYFRWANNATGGQTSKIVAQTFFPNCQPVP
jgi:hypothetical protein